MKRVLLSALIFCTVAMAATVAEAAPASRSCTYEKDGDMAAFAACTWTDRGGRLRLKRVHLRAQRFERNGLASLALGGGWAYVDRAGRLAPVMTYDNGADPFRNGLARALVGGRIGYVDRRLRLAIPARYDGAWPFENGRAVVCVGCVATRHSSGEHGGWEGGRWGCIDPRGREVVPLSAGAEDRTALSGGGCRAA
jgi:hypothetical protein